MHNRKLTDYLITKTAELRREIKAACTHAGEESWLFVPELQQSKVCLVAHIDTVHPEGWDAKRLVQEDGVITSPQGLGADDRAGVWAALEMFHSLPPELQPYVLLTDKEEVGCIGAREAAELFGDILRSPGITYFIEMDRKNSADAVFYNNEPSEFRQYVKSFGFEEAPGSVSDISYLGPAAGKCAVNLSTGYYNAHRLNEFLRVVELEATVAKVRLMLAENTRNPVIWKNPAAQTIPKRERKLRTHQYVAGVKSREEL